MHPLDHKVPPPVVGAVVAFAMWGVSDLGLQYAIQPTIRHALAGTLVVAGLTFDLLGLMAFRKSRTTINPLRPERTSTLVTHSVYRVTRNPMYVGMALLLLAWAVYLSSLLSLACIPLFILYITRFQIQPEERALRRNFGREFAEYAAHVRRWL